MSLYAQRLMQEQYYKANAPAGQEPVYNLTSGQGIQFLGYRPIGTITGQEASSMLKQQQLAGYEKSGFAGTFEQYQGQTSIEQAQQNKLNQQFNIYTKNMTPSQKAATALGLKEGELFYVEGGGIISQQDINRNLQQREEYLTKLGEYQKAGAKLYFTPTGVNISEPINYSDVLISQGVSTSNFPSISGISPNINYDILINELYQEDIKTSGIKIKYGFGDDIKGFSWKDIALGGRADYSKKEIYINKLLDFPKGETLGHEFGHYFTSDIKDLTIFKESGSSWLDFLNNLGYNESELGKEYGARSFLKYVESPTSFKSQYPEQASVFEKKLGYTPQLMTLEEYGFLNSDSTRVFLSGIAGISYDIRQKINELSTENQKGRNVITEDSILNKALLSTLSMESPIIGGIIAAKKTPTLVKLGVASSLVGFGESFVEHPFITTGTLSLTIAAFSTGVPAIAAAATAGVGYLFVKERLPTLISEPLLGTGLIAGDIIQMAALTKAIKGVESSIELTRTKSSPLYREMETSALGTKSIKNIPIDVNKPYLEYSEPSIINIKGRKSIEVEFANLDEGTLGQILENKISLSSEYAYNLKEFKQKYEHVDVTKTLLHEIGHYNLNLVRKDIIIDLKGLSQEKISELAVKELKKTGTFKYYQSLGYEKEEVFSELVADTYAKYAQKSELGKVRWLNKESKNAPVTKEIVNQLLETEEFQRAIPKETIKAVKSGDLSTPDVYDMGLIPKGKKGNIKLTTDPLRLVTEQIENIPYKKTPSFPELTPNQRELLEISKLTDSAISGSFAQETLLLKSRQFKDIDIEASDIYTTASAIKSYFGEKVNLYEKTIPMLNKEINVFDEGKALKIKVYEGDVGHVILEPNWKSGDYVKLYHGTTKESAIKIKNEGIKSGEELGHKRNIPNWGEEPYVSLTIDKKIAEAYAGKKGEVIEIRIPKNEFKKIWKETAFQDPFSSGEPNIAFTKSIRKEWIYNPENIEVRKNVYITGELKSGEKFDIAPKGISEEGFLKELGKQPFAIETTINVQGVELVRPEVRLAGKTAQLFKEGTSGAKQNKIIQDISDLTAGRINIDMESPTIKGAYGYLEQRKYIGKTGTITTSARDLFKGLEFKDLLSLERLKMKFHGIVEIEEGASGLGLFATPFEMKTGKPLTRITRLGIGLEEDASLFDYLIEDLSFRRTKPQIVEFRNEKIGRVGGFQVPDISSELQVTYLRKIRYKNLLAKTIIEAEGVKKSVDIIEAEIYEPTISEKKSLSKRGVRYTPEESEIIRGSEVLKTKKLFPSRKLSILGMELSSELTEPSLKFDISKLPSKEKVSTISREPKREITSDLTSKQTREPISDMTRDMTSDIKSTISREPISNITSDLISRPPTRQPTRRLTFDYTFKEPKPIIYPFPELRKKTKMPKFKMKKSRQLSYAPDLTARALEIETEMPVKRLLKKEFSNLELRGILK